MRSAARWASTCSTMEAANITTVKGDIVSFIPQRAPNINRAGTAVRICHTRTDPICPACPGLRNVRAQCERGRLREALGQPGQISLSREMKCRLPDRRRHRNNHVKCPVYPNDHKTGSLHRSEEHTSELQSLRH